MARPTEKIPNGNRAKSLANLTGRGRPKGVPNKTTTKVKEAILAALDKAGGVDYLARQADENPSAFLTLVGKVLPLQVTGEDGAPIQIEQVADDAAAFTSSLVGLAARFGAGRETGGVVH